MIRSASSSVPGPTPAKDEAAGLRCSEAATGAVGNVPLLLKLT
jgi:hypothetical protein